LLLNAAFTKQHDFECYSGGRGDCWQKKDDSMITRSFLAAAGILGTLLCVSVPSGSAQAQPNIEAEVIGLHQLCNQGDRRACVRFGILIGENRQRHADWRRVHADWFWWER
jgi:hypothetical protein